MDFFGSMQSEIKILHLFCSKLYSEGANESTVQVLVFGSGKASGDSNMTGSTNTGPHLYLQLFNVIKAEEILNFFRCGLNVPPNLVYFWLLVVDAS